MDIDYKAVLHWARLNAPLSGSRIHGERHWIQVCNRGQTLADKTSGADTTVVQLFGLLHDCQRKTDGSDPGHGRRAAEHILKIRKNLLQNLTDEQFQKLQHAITLHNEANISEDPTIGCCWDADRLEISRVGIRVQKRFLSTEVGRMLAG